MKILIDNGHGIETSGKRSPDGLFLEYAYTREIASMIVTALQENGYYAQLLVPEIEDIPLKERARRVNTICGQIGKDNVILISIHVNASASDGQWHKATGWCAYTTPGITKSDLLAYDLYEAAKLYLPNQKIRLFNGPKEPDFEENFYLLRHTKCTAVLTENLFQDCHKDVEFLQSPKGKSAITQVHISGVIEYIRNLKRMRT